MAALVVSGLPSGRFCFEGFLPRKGRSRAERLAALAAETRTTIVFEAPHRVRETVAELAATLGAERGVAVARELTKAFEEVWRGSLAGALEHLGSKEPRGEYVLVLAGAPDAGAPGDDVVEDALRARLEAGADKREAVASVTSELRVPRRRVYELATRLGKDGDGG
jgi:16S rRNA (cytidine1402-2'-O)-methyltransferase